MKKYQVQVCTISDQATPNYIPILDADFRPEIVILLVSQKMQEKASAFKKVLKHYCANVEIIELPILDEFDLTLMKERLFEVIAQLNIPTEAVGFNITGGTKLMAIEAYMLAKDLNCEPFYFIPGRNQVLFMNSKETASFVPQNLSIADYLQLHGYEIKNKPVRKNDLRSKDTLELLEQLIMLSPLKRNDLSAFYALIAAQNSKQLRFNVKDKHIYSGVEHIIELFEEYGFLTFKDDVIEFVDEADHKFAQGGWFEEYVFNIVKRSEGVQDCLMNIEIISKDQRDPKKAKNEVDVAYIKDNALHVIECKSKNYESRGNRSNNDIMGNSDLYKLETLQKLGGLYTRKIFISYHDVPDFMKERAEFSRIQLIELNHQTNLKTLLFGK